MAALPPTRPNEVRLAGEDRASPATSPRQVEVAVQTELGHSAYPELRHVGCQYHEGIVTLRGHVSSYFMKQMAQSIVQHVAGVERVVNRIEVARSPHAR